VFGDVGNVAIACTAKSCDVHFVAAADTAGGSAAAMAWPAATRPQGEDESAGFRPAPAAVAGKPATSGQAEEPRSSDN
jgi:hypothetical protein